MAHLRAAGRTDARQSWCRGPRLPVAGHLRPDRIRLSTRARPSARDSSALLRLLPHQPDFRVESVVLDNGEGLPRKPAGTEQGLLHVLEPPYAVRVVSLHWDLDDLPDPHSLLVAVQLDACDVASLDQ